ncbi:MAG: FecR domain-containing protein, partial [Acidobacteriota bacterium]|nr:FecR domain-containing protein [Acidobacteriota bacterium]
MKKLMIFIACLAFFVSLTFSYEAPEYYGYSYARLSYVKGDVFIQRTEDLGYEEGTVNLALVEGEKLGTREGRAEIHFGRKNYLRIDSYTQVDFIELPRRENDLIKLNLLSGSAYLRVNFLEREKDFEIHTPDASFYILDKGLYNFIVRDNKETEFHVLEGAAEAAGEKGSLLVNAEERLIAQNGYLSSDEGRFYENSGESFAEWNRSRDELC